MKKAIQIAYNELFETKCRFAAEGGFEYISANLSEYLELAVKNGSGIAVENLPVFHGIVPVMPFYSSNYEDLSTLVDSFDDENMQVCWDFGHANLMHFDQAEAIKFMGSRIKCTHVHNNFCHDDDHLPPDNGNIQWDKVMSALHSTGFDGPLTLETHCRYDDLELLRSFARHNYECLRFIEQFAK